MLFRIKHCALCLDNVTTMRMMDEEYLNKFINKYLISEKKNQSLKYHKSERAFYNKAYYLRYTLSISVKNIIKRKRKKKYQHDYKTTDSITK